MTIAEVIQNAIEVDATRESAPLTQLERAAYLLRLEATRLVFANRAEAHRKQGDVWNTEFMNRQTTDCEAEQRKILDQMRTA